MVRLTTPACAAGRVCTTVFNDGDAAVQVTVNFKVCNSNYQCSVTVPAQGSKDCCVSPTENGLCEVTASAPGATSKVAMLSLPCPG
jgi:hypothetical protein